MKYLTALNLTLCVALLFSNCSPSRHDAYDAASTDSLLRRLDQVVAHKKEYTQRKYHKIDSLKNLTHYIQNQESQAEISEQLFREYRGFRLDSTLFYARQIQELESPGASPEVRARHQMNVVEALKGVGKYKEAKSELDSIHGLHERADLNRLYHLYHSIYYQLLRSALETSDQTAYRDSILLYKRRILQTAPHPSYDYNLARANLLLARNKPWDTLKLLEQTRKQYHLRLDQDALLSSLYAEIYQATNQPDVAVTYLAYSSIADLRMANKQYTSLQKLAIILFNKGEIDRAYRYITCDMEDLNFSQAKVGLMELAEYLPIITSTYNTKAAEDRRLLRISLLCIISFSLLLVGVIFLLHKRGRKLELIQTNLDAKNNQLELAKEDLEHVASQLNEANRTKEAYIGQVFNLCSVYMDKQDLYRKTVSNLLKSNQLKELKKMVENKSRTDEELKELLHSFDAIFLSLFPDFIEHFNNLMQPDQKIEIREGELLSPELRIYALVRLGINDSVKIASFLHYSPQTVYNYRFKMRSRVKLPKQEFLQAVRDL